MMNIKISKSRGRHSQIDIMTGRERNIEIKFLVHQVFKDDDMVCSI